MTGTINIDEIIVQKSEIEQYKLFRFDDLPENMLDCCKQKCIDIQNFKGKTFFH